MAPASFADRMNKPIPVALLVLVLAAAGTLAGCGSTASTEAPSVAAASAIEPLNPTPVGGVTQPPDGAVDTVVVVAQNVAFQPGKIGVPANAPFTLVVDNRDAGVPHSIEVKDGSGATLVKSEVVPGPARLEVRVPALAPGNYPFNCMVHPNMTGVIIAQP
jgi:plastocyanin